MSKFFEEIEQEFCFNINQLAKTISLMSNQTNGNNIEVFLIKDYFKIFREKRNSFI